MQEKSISDPVSYKKEIAAKFGSAAPYYDQHAELRMEAANRLMASLQPWRDIIPSGPIAELGCGTGFVTKGLAELYPQRVIEAIDLSDQMVAYSREKLTDYNNLSFHTADAEQPDHEEPYYAMTVSGFAAHWFRDPALTLGRWMDATKPGGLLLASFPGNESFPNWRRHCQELGLPFTGNSLPDVEEVVVKMSVGPSQVDYYEDTIMQSFESAFDFFSHLKRIGANTQQSGRSLTSKELSLLMNHWDEKSGGTVNVATHMVFLAVKKDL